MASGADLLLRTMALVEREGHLLTVTRRPDAQGGSVTTQQIYFLVQPLTIGDDTEIVMEGMVSARQRNSYRFICAGDKDVREAVDRVTYNGFDYEFTNVNPREVQGTAFALHCTGVRT